MRWQHRYRAVPYSAAGFTLIELLISITILSLLVTVLYQAFSTASHVWLRQERFDEKKARQVAIRRLFESDFKQLVAYRYRHVKGTYQFFSATPSLIFYATRDGFGARNRGQHGLFFVCCYLRSEDDGSQSLRMFKTAFPERGLMAAFESFLQLDNQGRAFWPIPTELVDQSVTLIDGISQGSFFYTQNNGAELIDETRSIGESGGQLVPQTLPDNIRFSYQYQERWNHHYLRVDLLPDPAFGR